MASEIIDFLKERFAFAEWERPEERDQNVFVKLAGAPTSTPVHMASEPFLEP